MEKPNKTTALIPGALFVIIIAIPAWWLGKLMPLIGGPVLGILFGIVAACWHRPAIMEQGILFSSKKVLQAAIILLGFEMNLFNILKVGSQSLTIMICTLSAAFITAYIAGRYLKLDTNTRTLIGVGTAICGGSAIAATAPVISANDKEIAYSISTIFLFNIVAVFLFPFLGHLFQMSDIGFGIWAGTAINDTSSVVAAGYTYSSNAGDYATIVKLTRTLMIIPITLSLAIMTASKNTETKVNLAKVFPWFVLGFLAASLLSTTGTVSPAIGKLLTQFGKFFIIVAMTAIGLNTNLKQLINNGFKPIALGLLCWAAVAVTSLAIQHYLHIW